MKGCRRAAVCWEWAQAAQAEKCQAAQAAAKPSAGRETFQSSLLKVGGKHFHELLSRVNEICFLINGSLTPGKSNFRNLGDKISKNGFGDAF